MSNSLVFQIKKSLISRGLLFSFVLGITAILPGCGSSTKVSGAINSPNATTNVVTLFTGTANDRLTNFGLQIMNVSLSNGVNNSVTLFNRTSFPAGSTGLTEFMHLNGVSEPLPMTAVPQGTYTSATVTVGSCQFTTVTIGSNGGLDTATDAEGLCGQGTGNTTVNLPSPIVISGPLMALSFNLQVAQSFAITGTNTFTISPVFTLTPVTIAANPTNDQNGKFFGIDSLVTAVNVSGNGFTAQTSDGISLNVTVPNGNVDFQNINGLSSLAPGMIANLDTVIQSSGALQASRIEVIDSTATGSEMVLPTFPASPAGNFAGQPLDCFPPPGGPAICDVVFSLNNNPVFHISGQFDNLGNLPFPFNFSSSSLVLGQNVAIASIGARDGQGNLLATDLTLEPQTLNGTVTAISTVGSFTVYTVSLANYDLIPVTQQQVQGQFATITSPTTLTVYTDANTQLLEVGPIVAGSVLRFRGLLFDDSGVLRMDCSEIINGVPEQL